jgi:uncharacterized membrane protein YgcG
VKSLNGRSIEEYGVDLGRAWGIGQKGSNTGAILLVAPSERKVRIEVGYGLEGDLTDAASATIIDQAILPRFRQGDIPGGIVAGTEDILRILGDDVTAPAASGVERPWIDWLDRFHPGDLRCVCVLRRSARRRRFGDIALYTLQQPGRTGRLLLRLGR